MLVSAPPTGEYTNLPLLSMTCACETDGSGVALLRDGAKATSIPPPLFDVLATGDDRGACAVALVLTLVTHTAFTLRAAMLACAWMVWRQVELTCVRA